MELNRGGRLSIGTMLRQTVARYPTKTVIKEGDVEITYQEFNAKVNQFSNGLLSLGITKGDRVAFLFFNQWQFFICYFAATKIGAMAVPINYRLVPAEILYQLKDSGARVFVFDKDFLEGIERIRSEIPAEHYFCLNFGNNTYIGDFDTFLADQPVSEPRLPWEVGEFDEAAIYYTAGTTGNPKGALASHYGCIWAAIGAGFAYNINKDTRLLATAPFFHRGALETLHLMAFFAGGSMVMIPKFDPEKVMQLIDQEKITHAFIVPTMGIAFLNNPNKDRYDLTSLQVWMSGGTATPEDIRQRVLKELRLGGNVMYNGLGITENTIAANLTPAEFNLKPGSPGKAAFGCEIKIIDDDGHILGTGQPGEIVVFGPQSMVGYWNNPEETAKAIWEHDGRRWLRTGDIGYLDDDGYLFISDRKKDMVISGGENVYSLEVENVLITHPKIFEVAIIGTPDPTWGELVTAVVALKPGETATAEEIVDYCRDKIAGYKRPRRVEFVEALPHNSFGKVQKNLLREQFGVKTPA